MEKFQVSFGAVWYEFYSLCAFTEAKDLWMEADNHEEFHKWLDRDGILYRIVENEF